MAIVGQDFPRLHFPHGVFRVYCRQFLVPQVFRQALCPGPGTGQKQHPVSVAAEHFQVSHQRLKTVVIGSHIPGRRIGPSVCLKIPFGIHGGNRDHAAFQHNRRHLLPAVENVHLSRQNVTLLHPLLHAFPEFQFDGLCLLPHAARFLHKKDRTSVRRHPSQQFRKHHRILIKIADIAFQVDLALKFQQLFLQLFHLHRNPVRLLRVKSVTENLFLPGSLRFQLSDAFPDPFFLQHKFRGRKNTDTFQVFNGALA